MQDRIDQQVLEVVYKVQLRDPGEMPAAARPAPGLAAPPMVGPRRQPGPAGAAPAGGAVPEGKVGRNDPCPCGSGRKYKKCHGAAA
jgi:preprotein translocase subunit SecA